MEESNKAILGHVVDKKINTFMSYSGDFKILQRNSNDKIDIIKCMLRIL